MKFKSVAFYITILLFVQSCDTTNTNSKYELKEYLIAEIEGTSWQMDQSTDWGTPKPLASYIPHNDKKWLSVGSDTLAPFPYRLSLGFTLFPLNTVLDTTFTFTDDINNFDHAWAYVAEADDDVAISLYLPVPDINNQLNIKTKFTEEGTEYLEGTFQVKLALDGDRGSSAHVKRKFSDTLYVTNGKFRLIPEDRYSDK